MQNLTFSDILQLITSLGIIVALFANMGTMRQRGDNKVAEQAEMKADIKYIKEKIDGVDTMRDTLTELRASCKSAHKRLDEHLTREHGQKIKIGDGNE